MTIGWRLWRGCKAGALRRLTAVLHSAATAPFAGRARESELIYFLTIVVKSWTFCSNSCPPCPNEGGSRSPRTSTPSSREGHSKRKSSSGSSRLCARLARQPHCPSNPNKIPLREHRIGLLENHGQRGSHGRRCPSRCQRNPRRRPPRRRAPIPRTRPRRKSRSASQNHLCLRHRLRQISRIHQ